MPTKFDVDCPCHYCEISRGLPMERATSHKQYLSSCAWAPWGPTKRPTFCWWNVQMLSIQKWCCVLTKFRSAVTSICNFFKYWYVFILGTNLIAPASIERKLDFQLPTYVSSSVCRIKTGGFISMQFTGNNQLHILYTSTKFYADWMSASGSFFCVSKMAITFTCTELLMSVDDDQHFSVL